MRSQGKQFMLLSSQLEVASMNLQSVHNMSTVHSVVCDDAQVSDAMASSVQAIKAASTSLDLSRV